MQGKTLIYEGTHVNSKFKRKFTQFQISIRIYAPKSPINYSTTPYIAEYFIKVKRARIKLSHLIWVNLFSKQIIRVYMQKD